MGAINGYKKGDFPGKWHLEKTCVAPFLREMLPKSDWDHVPRILDYAGPTEEEWNFLKHRAMILGDYSGGFWPDANAWRQAILETIAWGQMHNRNDHR